MPRESCFPLDEKRAFFLTESLKNLAVMRCTKERERDWHEMMISAANLFRDALLENDGLFVALDAVFSLELRNAFRHLALSEIHNAALSCSSRCGYSA